MDLALIVQVLETEEELATDDGDMGLGEWAGLEKIQARASGQELHYC